MGDKCGGLGIKCAVTLYLVCVCSCVAVEKVAVMYPYMVVVLLETAVVSLIAVTSS